VTHDRSCLARFTLEPLAPRVDPDPFGRSVLATPPAHDRSHRVRIGLEPLPLELIQIRLSFLFWRPLPWHMIATTYQQNLMMKMLSSILHHLIRLSYLIFQSASTIHQIKYRLKYLNIR